MRRKGLEKNIDCKADREIVQIIDQTEKRSNLVDSGFYESAYCDIPYQFSQPPRVYEMEELPTKKSVRRKLAVIEFSSTTIQCPDIEDKEFRHFMIIDLEDSNKVLLDVVAEFVIPEIGDDVPYRLQLFNVSKVIQSSIPMKENQLPFEIELKSGNFVVSRSLTAKNIKNSVATTVVKKIKDRIKLNKIYSKDSKKVYYETVDSAGIIAGADPKTFQLLSETGESAYTKDSKNVFFFGKVVPKADAKTFVQLNERFGKDVNHIFHMETILTEADHASFVAPFKNVWYAIDKNSVFSGHKIVKEADPTTFSTGEDRSCGENCTYRSDDKNYRFDGNDKVVQKLISTK